MKEIFRTTIRWKAGLSPTGNDVDTWDAHYFRSDREWVSLMLNKTRLQFSRDQMAMIKTEVMEETDAEEG